MKKCSMCKIDLPFSSYNKNSKRSDGLQTMCRECWKTYYKKNYYLNGKEKQRLYAKNKEKKEEIIALIRNQKNVPCADCGIKYPYYVMDFDHIDRSKKEYTIARLVSCGNIEKVKKEIQKCEVVCSNCHRIRTHGS